MSFHPLPISDAWGGEIGYWTGGRRFGWSSLWAFHNEHRIPFSRILYWIDVRAFHGGGVFLVLVDLALLAVLAGTIAWLARAVLREGGTPPRSARAALVVGALVATAIAATQLENLVFPFQSTLLLAALLPLLACITAAAAVGAEPDRRPVLAAVASALGLASIGTAASGLAAPFVVAFVLWAGGTRLRRVSFDLVAGAVALVLYRVGSAANRPDGFAGPVLLVRYLLTWFGSTVGAATSGRIPAEPFGLAFLVGVALVTWRALRRTVRRPYELAGLGHLAMVLATGALTAVGRSTFGPAQALASRYQTLALSGLVVLVVLIVADPPRILLPRARSIALALALPVGLLPAQIRSLDRGWGVEWPHLQRVVAVALALHTADADTIRIVRADTAMVQRVARTATAQGITVLARQPYRTLADRIGRPDGARRTGACSARLEVGATLPTGGYRRVQGVVDRRGGRTERDGITPVIDRRARVVGFVVVGTRSPVLQRLFGVTASPPPGAEATVGYVRADTTGPLRVVVGSTACRTMPA